MTGRAGIQNVVEVAPGDWLAGPGEEAQSGLVTLKRWFTAKVSG